MPLDQRPSQYFDAPETPTSVLSCPDCGGTSWTILSNRDVYCNHCDICVDLDLTFLSITH